MDGILDARKPGRLWKGKKIKGGCVRLEPGKNVGAHSTGQGEEFILVLEGEATAKIGGKLKKVKKDQCVFVPSDTLHDVMNLSDGDLLYLYFVGGADIRNGKRNGQQKRNAVTKKTDK
jgi:mannose-6-phosphate isomerase-like protein (cupin superfamily)